MPQYRLKQAEISVLLCLTLVTGSIAADFTQCFANVVNCATNASSPSCALLNTNSTTALSYLRTSRGDVVNITNAANLSTGLSYSGCRVSCGNSQEPFQWSLFSQEYAAWLLPYLALISQLPFGAKRRMDNLMSAVLTIGSPMLAGYSLYMTFLNARWVNDKLFSAVDYPNPSTRRFVVTVLSSLQQVPLRIHPGRSGQFESLVVHPKNDGWWTTFARGLDYWHTWSIASAISITWVIIAYLLNVADSLSNVAVNIQVSGEATASGWLWLLPVVVGWLMLSPKCNYQRVHDAYDKANKQVYVADCHDANAPPTQVTSNFGLTISPSPDWEQYGRNITSPDESRIPPIFNYSRTLMWCRTAYMTSLFYRAAQRRWLGAKGADGQRITIDVHQHATQESRLGTRRHVMEYSHPDVHEYPGKDVLWPPGMLFNMVVASLMALLLQWGTTGAAVLAAWFTPTVGLGCRSFAYLLYGALSTLVWVLLVSSSILGYYAHHMTDGLFVEDLESIGDQGPSPIPHSSPTSVNALVLENERGVALPMHEIHTPKEDVRLGEDVPLTDGSSSLIAKRLPLAHRGRLPFSAQTLGRIANWLRWIGKAIAIFNAIEIVASSVFQFARVYDNCFCNASVYYWGTTTAFNVINVSGSDVDLTRSAWVGGLALALTCSTFFIGSIYLTRDSLPS